MENKERTYTITESRLDEVKAEIMKQFDKYAMKGLVAKIKKKF